MISRITTLYLNIERKQTSLLHGSEYSYACLQIRGSGCCKDLACYRKS